MEKVKLTKRSNQGITLIALIITVIVMLILAGVAISIIIDTGIFDKTDIAREEHNKQTATEIINLKITNVQISKYAEKQSMPTLKELADNFCEDDDIQYVQETSKVASLTKIDNENPTSIYTKLKAYPYEFEINSSLQLASIDGVKIADNTNTETVSKSDYDQLVALVTTLSQKVTNLENNQNSVANPTGTIIAYSANLVPNGYLKCEGQEVSRTEYKALFDIIGTTYGSGDGNTTFNVPDLRGEFLRGTGTNNSTGFSGDDVGVHQKATEHLQLGIDYRMSGYARIYGQMSEASNFEPLNPDSQIRSTNKTGWSLDKEGNKYSTWDGSGVSAYTSRPTNTSVLYCIKY